MVTFAAATKPTSTIPTRAPAQCRVGVFVAITCSDPNDSCDLYSDDCRTHAQLVSPSRDPIGYEAGSYSVYCYVQSHCLTKVDPTGLAPDPMADCKSAIADFLKVHQTEWDKKCGKEKFTYPFTLDISCESDSEKGRCFRKPDTDGFHSCVNGRFSGDTEKIIVCADRAGGKTGYLATLAHEWIHALDSCTCNNNCKQSLFPDTADGKKSACETAACAEIRAYSYVDCRNVAPADFRKCVLDGAKRSLPKDCAPAPMFDKCVVKQGDPITYPPPVIN